MPHQHLAPAFIPGSGRGLVTEKVISKKGQIIGMLPQHLLITPHLAQHSLSSTLGLNDGEITLSTIPSWTILALYLAHLRHGSGSNNNTAGPSSPSSPSSWQQAYVDLLPNHTGGIVEWSDTQVDWLQGSVLHDKAIDIRSAARSSWEDSLSLLSKLSKIKGGRGVDWWREDSSRWAFSMLLSRLVRLPSCNSDDDDDNGGEEMEALVPWLDLANHDSQADTYLDWDASSQCVVMKSWRAYKAGEEVTISYGQQKTGGEMLLSYGFIPNNGTGTGTHDDACLLTVSAPCSIDGTTTSRIYPLRMGALPEGIDQWAAWSTADSERELERMKGMGSSRDSISSRDNGEMRRRGLERIVLLCKASLKQRQQHGIGGLEDNKQELAELLRQNGGGGEEEEEEESRRSQVLKVLIAEQKILHRTVFLLQQELKR
jgi:hypothetical protein